MSSVTKITHILHVTLQNFKIAFFSKIIEEACDISIFLKNAHTDFFPIPDGNKFQCVTVEQKFYFPNSFSFHLSIVNHCPSIHTIFQPYSSSSFFSVFTSLHLATRMLVDISIYPSMEQIFYQQNSHRRLGDQSHSFLSSEMK